MGDATDPSAAAMRWAAKTAEDATYSYRMSRVLAEQRALRDRAKANFWRHKVVRRAMLAAAITAAFAVGWWAYKADVFGFRWPATAVQGDQAPADAQKETRVKPAATGQGAVATGVAVGVANVDPGAELVVLDAIDVPFVRGVGDIGASGKDSVWAFVRGNAMATKFGVTAMVGLGENDLLADARASAVVSQLLVLGVDRAKVQIDAPQKTADDAPVTVTGARVSVYAQAKRTPASILTGAPLEALGPVGPMPTPLKPAFGGDNEPKQESTRRDRVSAPRADTDPNGEAESLKSRAKAGQRPDGEVTAGMKELAEAVKTAAARNANIDRRSVAGATVAGERSGVSVTLGKKPATDQAGKVGAGMGVGAGAGSESATPKAVIEQVNPQASKTGSGYKIVGRYGWGVLLQTGNSIKSIKVGEALPDGSKLTKEAAAVPE